MPTILEPIGAGIAVAIINKLIINNSSLWSFCSGSRPNNTDEYEDDVSSTNTSVADTVEVHAHFP
jgi:hypothetical protein